MMRTERETVARSGRPDPRLNVRAIATTIPLTSSLRRYDAPAPRHHEGRRPMVRGVGGAARWRWVHRVTGPRHLRQALQEAHRQRFQGVQKRLRQGRYLQEGMQRREE